MDISGVSSLFEGEKCYEKGNLLQTMIYSMVLHNTLKRNVKPALYYVRQMTSEDYNPHIIDNIGTPRTSSNEVDYLSYADEFEQMLREKLLELFNPDIPFVQCGDEQADKACSHCDFKTICRR